MPVYRFLMGARVRARYIPIVRQFTTYDRKEEILRHCLECVNFAQIQGDYLEFGVWKGGSLMNAYHIAKRLKHLQAMRFYVFDSFEGLPEKAWQDAECAVFKKGDYAFTLEEVRRNLERNGVDVNEITFIKGWYKEVLNVIIFTASSFLSISNRSLSRRCSRSPFCWLALGILWAPILIRRWQSKSSI